MLALNPLRLAAGLGLPPVLAARRALAFAGLATLASCRGHTPHVETTSPPAVAGVTPRSAFVTVSPGVQLHYLDWRGRGEPVLLLPGLYGSAEIYWEFAPLLTDRFRVLALSRRGHGRSDEPSTGYEPDSLVEDIRAVLDSLGIRRTHLVGHSLAGVELTGFASRYPERVHKLVYLDAAYDRQHQRRLPANPVRTVGVRPDLSSPEAYVASMRHDPYWGAVWSHPVEAQLRAVLTPAEGGFRPKPSAETLARIRRSIGVAPPRYDSIRAPVLSIYALVDSLPELTPDVPRPLRDSAVIRHRSHVLPYERASVEQLRRARPDARIVELRGTHHHLFIQRRDEIARLVREFLLEK